jgi:hypothetical protein
MTDFGTLTTIPLTIIVVPLVLSKLPYFRRPQVVARRVAKAKLPSWVSIVELLLFATFLGVGAIASFAIEERAHEFLLHGAKILVTAPSGSPALFVFSLIEILAPVIMVLPSSMLFANGVSWLISPIKKHEDEIMAKGISGYTWHDANLGLIKASLIIVPVCMILAILALLRV